MWFLGKIAIVTLFGVQVVLGMPQIKLADLRCESASRPLGLDALQPRLSWKLKSVASGLRAQRQSAYRILAASSLDRFANDTGDLWDSGRIESAASVGIPYAGKNLTENQRVFWKVQVWDQAGNASDWSEVSEWTMGLFDNASWAGKWIGGPGQDENARNLEVRFTIRKEAMSVYFRAQGVENSCMWQINTTGGRVRFSPHIRVDGGFRVLKEVPLPMAPSAFAQPHTMKITMNEGRIDTFLDGKLIDTTTEESRHGSGLGFRASPTEETLIHELTLTSADGKVLYHSDFPSSGLVVANQDVSLTTPNPALTPLLRKEFTVGKPVRRAWVHSSALGIYEMRLNGQKVGDAFFAPGWTNYRKTVQYQTYDVTALMRPGANALGAQLAPGWFAGKIGWFGPARYGREPRLIAELHVEYEDGSAEIVARTDDSWKTSAGPVVAADYQDGETYDARLEQPGWDRSAFKDAAWSPVRLFDSFEQSRLVSQADPLMNVLETLAPLAVSEPKPGVFVYQLPRNITGIPRVKIRGTAGSTVRIRCSEAVNPDGSLNQKTQVQPGVGNMFSANTDTYTFGKTGEAIYQPRFSWRGFRYIEISGTVSKPALADVAGLSIGTHVPDTGTVQTSDDLINRIFNIMKWSGQCAFISIPVDSPQRCERLGWTGDANFYLKTAAFNFDIERFFTKWQRDGIQSQTAEGCFSNVSPGGWGTGADGGYAGGWGDVGVCLPYELWKTYGNTALVRESYAAMVKFIDYLQSQGTEFILPDALAPAGDWQNQNDGTPANFIATAYFAYDVKLMAEMARMLDKREDSVKYDELFQQVRAAIRNKWIARDGRVATGSQTAQVMALHVGLVPDDLKQAAGERLVENITAHKNHLTTGFVGTQWLLPVLSEIGRTDLACAILRQTDNPSWGYMVKSGSTTIWENWNVVKLDGTISDGANSLNHCALGTAGEWIFRNVGGIDQDAAGAGFSQIVIRPSVTGTLQSATARFESVHGTIATDWKKDPRGLTLKVEIPVNTTAIVHVPCANAAQVKEGKFPASKAPSVDFLREQAGYAVFAVGSGSYEFNSP